ncbi:ribonucleoside-diphosphate reductase subunit M1, partial [Pancytospora epiphaga]
MAILITLENYGALIPEYVKEHGLSHANTSLLRERIDNGIVKSMSSHALAYYAGEVAASMITQHPDYGRLAAVILASYHTAVTTASFSEKIRLLDQYVGNLKGTLVDFVAANSAEIDAYIDYSRDFNLSYFALNSLIRSYMLRINDTPIERPQDIFMRVAVQICGTDLRRIKETYDLISLGIYTHSTPTLFNSLLEKSQLASCFLVTIKGDDISGIFETIGDCALISKHSGGLGVNLHEIRCAGSPLVSSGGASKGIIPIMRIINETMKYVNQGGTKRNSSIAFYLEPWHCDIMQFIDVRKNTGPEEYRAREVFVAIWMNDLFMERVINNEEWSLFDPNQAKGLHEVWGDEFRKLYTKYEKTVSRKTIRAQDLWKQIVIAQVETGTPYIVYKDTCNRLSNQNHLGTIK